MIAARTSHPPSAGDPALWLCALLAIAVHGSILFAWKFSPEESAAATIEGDSIEVALVESAPGAAAAVVEPEPPVAPPEPVPVPPPEPPKKEPEMTIPEASKPTPPPRPAPAATPLPKATPRPPAVRRSPVPQNSTASGTVGGASAAAGTAAGGVVAGKSVKATYIVRPAASYPPESRAAGEHGVVILRLVVDGNGRPTAVTVGRSSGYPRLDCAAVEAGWRARVRDATPGSRLDAPVRFNLTDR